LRAHLAAARPRAPSHPVVDLGPDQATDYVNATEETESGDFAIHMRPERWNSFDFRRMLDG
jgi:hypothetical protein